jgi:outer membrane protein
MTKTFLKTVVVGSLLTTLVQAAPGVSFQAGGGVWQPEISGTTSYGTNLLTNNVDFGNLGMEKGSGTTNNFFFADFSHPVPIIPNIRVERLVYELNGSANQDLTFGDYHFSGDVTTKMNQEQMDYILYWTLPFIKTLTNNHMVVKWGVDVKNVKGEVSIKENLTGNYENAKIDQYLPLGYVGLDMKIPALPIKVSTAVKGVAYKDASIVDAEAKISGVVDLFVFDVNLDAGYRIQKIKIPSSLVDDFEADLQVKGLFFGANIKF